MARKISGATVWWIDPVTLGLGSAHIPSSAIFSGRTYASEAEYRMPVGVVHSAIVLDGESPDAALAHLRAIASSLNGN